MSREPAWSSSLRSVQMRQTCTPDASDGRDKLHKEYAAGTQSIERAHAQAQTQMEDRLVEDQAGVIANLWRILSWAGISPQQALPDTASCARSGSHRHAPWHRCL